MGAKDYCKHDRNQKFDGAPPAVQMIDAHRLQEHDDALAGLRRKNLIACRNCAAAGNGHAEEEPSPQYRRDQARTPTQRWAIRGSIPKSVRSAETGVSIGSRNRPILPTFDLAEGLTYS